MWIPELKIKYLKKKKTGRYIPSWRGRRKLPNHRTRDINDKEKIDQIKTANFYTSV